MRASNASIWECAFADLQVCVEDLKSSVKYCKIFVISPREYVPALTCAHVVVRVRSCARVRTAHRVQVLARALRGRPTLREVTGVRQCLRGKLDSWRASVHEEVRI
eukprot:6211391-Pleurochrysis_carterae.AAC.3